MDELKKYSIGGKTFVMPPLTLGQKALIAKFEKEIGERIVSYGTPDILLPDSVAQLAAFLSGDASIVWGIDGIAELFGTILVEEGKTFDKKNIPANSAFIESATIGEVYPVLIDFFVSALASRSALMSFYLASETKSAESASSSDSTETKSTPS